MTEFNGPIGGLLANIEKDGIEAVYRYDKNLAKALFVVVGGIEHKGIEERVKKIINGEMNENIRDNLIRLLTGDVNHKIIVKQAMEQMIEFQSKNKLDDLKLNSDYIIRAEDFIAMILAVENGIIKFNMYLSELTVEFIVSSIGKREGETIIGHAIMSIFKSVEIDNEDIFEITCPQLTNNFEFKSNGYHDETIGIYIREMVVKAWIKNEYVEWSKSHGVLCRWYFDKVMISNI